MGEGKPWRHKAPLWSQRSWAWPCCVDPQSPDGNKDPPMRQHGKESDMAAASYRHWAGRAWESRPRGKRGPDSSRRSTGTSVDEMVSVGLHDFFFLVGSQPGKPFQPINTRSTLVGSICCLTAGESVHAGSCPSAWAKKHTRRCKITPAHTQTHTCAL